MTVVELKKAIIEMIEKMPDDKVERIYKVLMSLPFINKMKSGGDLTEEELTVMDERFKEELAS